LLFASLLLLACIGFIALGNWQLQRRAWKLDLIARVDARLQAPVAPAPGRDEWERLTVSNDEYRHVCINGTLLNGKETLVQAATRLGPGSWVLTPLQAADGSLVFINRGFVDRDHRDPASRTATDPENPQHFCGLLRFSEPRGAFLHHNDPLHDRWHSRDIAAIAAARGLERTSVAPYFLDADAGADPSSWPVGGLTVVQFHNNHLSYALTWYGLALLSVAGLFLLLRRHPDGRVQSGQAV
jgi:surfeit locus 1 family protein